MAISLINTATDKFLALFSAVNAMITLWNSNDVTGLETITQVSLRSAINEVNSKTVPFYPKDSATKTNIELEV